MAQREDEQRLATEVDAPRGATSREWELFVREAPADSLTHAGSVSAPSEAIAREQATSLFGDRVTALWLCPADEMRRFQTAAQSLAGTSDDADPTMDREQMATETLQGERE